MDDVGVFQSEDQKNPYLAMNLRYHGVGGPLTVSEAPYRTPLSRAFLEAADYLGQPLRDTTAEPHSGFQFMQVNTT